MKILITGANGQLGYHLQQTFADHDLYLGDLDNYDITKRDIVLAETEKFQPDVIIHGAAYTNVDGAETNRELCRAINVDGSRHVAEAARRADAKLVAISTDYVFAGDSDKPYKETDTPAPISYYGQTKYEGEQEIIKTHPAHFICRTAWLYGGPKPTQEMDFSANPIKNFVYTMLRVGKDRDSVEVVNDQWGGPTYAHDLAETIKQLIETDEYGIYHVTNSGVTSWAKFAELIFDLAGYKTEVRGITSEAWAAKNPTATKRPHYSVLAHTHLASAGLAEMRTWEMAIADFLSEQIKAKDKA